MAQVLLRSRYQTYLGGKKLKTILLAAAAAFSLTAGATTANAQSQTLTFDDLAGCCYGSGEGYPMLSNMAFDGTNLTYKSGAYILSFAGGSFAHIGDGTYATQTYNWHDGPDNLTGSPLSLARIDGGAFDLTSFSYDSDRGFTLTAAGFTPQLLASGTGTASPTFTNVRTVVFSALGFRNQLDNIVVNPSVSAVPEPATWAMMLMGFGLMGFAMRRRSNVETTVSYA